MFKSPVIAVGAHLLPIMNDEVDDNIRVTLRFEEDVTVMLEMATNCFIL